MIKVTVKKLVLTLGSAILINLTVQGADVICEKGHMGWWYPKNELAKRVAMELKVKTCNGKAFHDFVKKGGKTTNAPIRGKKTTSQFKW